MIKLNIKYYFNITTCVIMFRCISENNNLVFTENLKL